MVRRAAAVDLHGRRVVVTGASPGSLGAATARILSDWGARVVITTRADSAAAARVIGDDVVGHDLELTDRASVRDFARWCVETWGSDGLDVLVNNAGVHLDLRSSWTEPQLTPDGYEIHWRTNYLGTMQLTELMLPLLVRATARSGEARVVNVVSKLHTRGRNRFLFEPLECYHSWDAYGQSKLAMVHASSQLAVRCEASNLRVYAVHPGSVYSHIADRGLEGHRVIGALRKVLAPLEARLLLSPDEGAQTSVFCATAAMLPSGYYRDCAKAEPSAEAQDSGAAARLWQETQLWIDSTVT